MSIHVHIYLYICIYVFFLYTGYSVDVGTWNVPAHIIECVGMGECMTLNIVFAGVGESPYS